MTLLSPGVEVTVVDQSQYIPAAVNSVPYILLATAQNKVSGTGVGVAAGTLKANANKVYLITSQRDLSATYGVPFFYKTTAGTPINGYELNEYGLLAAYSALGITNRAYIQRVDVDLAALTASLIRPVGTPPDGTYWLDTANSLWGLFQWNITTSAFTNQIPMVITDSTQLEPSSTVPLQSIGSIGDYAITATNVNNPGYYKRGGPTASQTSTPELFDYYNHWVEVGSGDWQTAWPTVQGTLAPTTIPSGNAGTFTINGTTITVSSGETVAAISNAINSVNITGVYSAYVDGKLQLYGNSTAHSDEGEIVVAAGTGTPLDALGITAGTYYVPTFLAAPNYSAPRWRSTDAQPAPTGSVWQRTNSVNLGANLSMKKYSTLLGTYVQQNCNIYADTSTATYTLDPSGGGKNIVGGTTVAVTNPEYNMPATLGLEIFERYAAGATVVTGKTTTPGPFTINDEFTIAATVPGQASLGAAVTVTLTGTTVSAFLTAVSAAVGSSTFASYVTATVNSSGAIVFTHSAGGDIVVKNTTGTPLTTAGFVVNPSTPSLSTQFCRAGSDSSIVMSYWVGQLTFTYYASSTGPDQDPVNGTYWYYSSTTQADIMIQNNGAWCAYQTVENDVRGDDLQLTNPTGPIFSTTAPTTQTDSTPLVSGDLWIDTSDLENYPVINRWSNIQGVEQWVTINNTDQTTQNGILFADARWSPNGLANPVTDALPTIASLLTSSYLDLDAPDPTLYPQGTLLWNTRRSGFNVKSFEADYFNTSSFYVPVYSGTTTYMYNDFVNYNGVIYVCLTTPPGAGYDPMDTAYWSALDMVNGGINTWVTASGNKNDGAPYMGRQAQRAIIVAALKSGIDSSVQAREEQRQFNLIACPQYPELMPNMTELNNDRKNTAFVIGDTPLRLGSDSTSLTAWHSNNNGLGLPTGDGQTSFDSYLGVFYPSCQTTDLSGSPVVQPPSHMMIRTIIRSDEIAYPWLAPAGTLRGVIDNAALLGYVNGVTGEFVTIGVNQTLRDVLYQLNINPITFVPGIGITNFGNKTATSVTTAMDRINVARLVAFIRGRLTEIGNQYLFEPNDQITRNQITNSVTSLMLDLVAKRGIYDYLVVCDLSNNSPATIDANELYVDIAIEPVKAVEFIYIPLRIQNTGTISSSVSTVATAG
jgi:Phage tail sheath C-terminal domain